MGERGRGWFGIVLFATALITMPVLVVIYDPKPATLAAMSGDTPAGTASASPTDAATTGTADRKIKDFIGFDGSPLEGIVDIQLDYEGQLGPVHFEVRNSRTGFEYLAGRPPYLLDPHDPKLGGWNTRFVPNGEYTIIATSTWDPRVSRTARFIVRNS